MKQLGCAIFLCCALLAGNAEELKAQGKAEDFERADQIRKAMEQDVLYAPSAFEWLPGEHKFWYQQRTPEGNVFMMVDAETRKRWSFDPETYGLTGKKQADADKTPPVRNANRGLQTSSSPDGQWEGLIKDHNIYIRAVAGHNEFQLSHDGTPAAYYAADLKWSPDSKKLAIYKIKPVKVRQVYLIESSPEDQLQPKLHSRNYPKPGDSLPENIPCLFDIAAKQQIPVKGVPVDGAFSLSPITWRKDSRAFTFEYNKRGFQLFQVVEANAVSGQLRPLITETNLTFIAREKRYRYDVNDGKELIWTSERDGWNHLYLYDGLTGKLKNQITKGDWVVRKVVHVDEKNRTIIFQGSGREPGESPYHIHYYRIGFDGKGLKALTSENANHTAFFSDDYRWFADTYSRMDLPPVAVLRSAADGKIIMTLEKADISGLLKTGWKMAEVFHAKGRDGSTEIWGTITRPSNFNPAISYPVIEYIYAGPHESFVPQDFNGQPKSGDYRTSTALHELAELGFIVVQMDGMGTSNRSKAFHDVCWKNLKDAGFPDRIPWIKAAAAKYPYMDTTRVGIYGNSAGGQSSVGALLFHPEFYKVAVSSSGCHDNRMDKIGWNESWMGYPVGPQYAASSNVTHAAKLKGKLLLILGEMDTNVPPESTLQLVNALIKAGKDFDFLMVPGMGHSLGGAYGEHKRRDFFVKNLLGVTPPAWETQTAVTEKEK